ncbi:MAG TPA: hypothetical protein VFK57_13055 [Vicinamibacterales bacterium]|nr:hypothetical protein [Vicinamibacterales bacterium]
MQLPPSRSVVIISGLLTLLVLGGVTLAVGFRNGWLRTGADAASREMAAASAPLQPAQPSPAAPVPDETAVYRQRLEDAYRALDEAYAQIRTLQSPPRQLASVRGGDGGYTGHDEDDDRRERRPRRRESHDE